MTQFPDMMIDLETLGLNRTSIVIASKADNTDTCSSPELDTAARSSFD